MFETKLRQPVLSILVVTFLALTALATTGGALASGGTLGHVTPAAGSHGVVTIYANGTVSDPTAPIAISGSTYTLTGELNGSVVIRASNIAFDGARFLVNYTVGEPGGNGAAVTVDGVAHDTLQNVRSANATVGVLVNNSTSIQVAHNDLSASAVGIQVANSTQVEVNGNWANTTSSAGTFLYQSSFVTVSGNVYGKLSPRYALYAAYSSQLTISGNNGNGSRDGFEVDYSTNVVLDGNNASFSSTGIGGYYCVNLLISNNLAFGSAEGVWVENSANSTVSNNHLAHDADAIYDNGNTGLLVEGNYAPWSGATGEAVYSYSSVNVSYLGNNFSHSLNEAVYLYETAAVTVADNNLSSSYYYGVYDYYAYGWVNITGNDLSNSTYASGYGVYVYETYGAVQISGNLMDHLYDGVYAEYNYGPVNVTGNRLDNASDCGVYAYESYDSILVAHNDLSNSYCGVEVDYQYGGSVNVSWNTLVNDSSYPVYIDPYNYGGYGVTVEHNVIANSSSTYGAVYLYESDGPVHVDFNLFLNVYTGLSDEYQWGGVTTFVGNSVVNATYGLYDYYSGYSYRTYEYSPTPLVAQNNTLVNVTDYGIYDYYSYGAVTVTGNHLTDSSDAVYLDEPYYGSVSVSDNSIINSSTAIYIYDASGSQVLVSDNRIVNATSYGIDVEDTYALDVITGNTILAPNGTAIYEYDSYLGGSIISDNHAAGALTALYLDSSSYANVVTGNDFSGSGQVYVGYSTVTSFVGNNLLGDASIDFVSDTIGVFDHNDLNSSAFAQSLNSVGGSWNAAYPVGGNYWTGYTGADAYSGAAQTTPGADGIGDTPYTIAGAVDRYPLMVPWVSPIVTFQETGLPATATWSVMLNGVTQSTGAGGSVGFAQTNGAYTPFTYRVTSSDARYAPNAASGSGVLSGASQVVTVRFAPVEYAFTFNETGLASGTSWTVVVGGSAFSSTASTIVVNETNGTYAYTVPPVSGFVPSPANGSVGVNGAGASVSIAFAKPKFSVTFIETGLPAGAAWSVTVNGVTVPSTSPSAVVSLPNGTYTYSVTVPTGYVVTPASASVTVAGGAVSVYLVAGVSGTSTSSNGGSTVSTSEAYGLAAALVLALVLALVGWALYLRRRPGAGAPPNVPAGASMPGAPPSAGAPAPTDSATPPSSPSEAPKGPGPN